jgi:hypothetical protein
MTAVRRIWKYLAATESGTCVWINDIVPDTAARRLREAE